AKAPPEIRAEGIFMQGVSKQLTRLSTLILRLAAAGIVVMTAIIGWQIFGRYILNDTPIWSERLSLYLMIYYILFASAVGVRQGFHLGLVLFRESLSGVPRLCVELLVHLCVGGFGLAMIIYGSALAATTWGHVIPTLGISTGTSYLPFPIAGVLIVLFSAEHIAKLFTPEEVAP
ncbi:MAG: TRAP transporter small permease, partial [Hyphomicrobiales bacterium]